MAKRKTVFTVKYFIVPSILVLIFITSLLFAKNVFEVKESLDTSFLNKSKAAAYLRYSTNKRNSAFDQTSNDYQIEKIDEKWGLLVSEDMNFEMKIPHGAAVNKGGGERGAPEPIETIQLSINLNSSRDIDKKANIIVGIEMGINPFSDVKEAFEKIVIEDYYNGGVFKSNENSERIQKAILGNANGYELYETVNAEKLFYKYNFMTERDQYFVHVSYFYPWSGTNLTSNEKDVVGEMLSSFRFLD